MKLCHKLLCALSLSIASCVAFGNGMVSVLSQNNVQHTVQNLETQAKRLGLRILLRLDHGKKVEQDKVLLLVEDPSPQAALIEKSATAGMDFPIKLFTYQDNEKRVWITYSEPLAIAAKHNLGNSVEAEKMSQSMANLTLFAAKK